MNMRQYTTPVYDLWLDKYKNLLDASAPLPILDLGCGTGSDTLYLTERGYSAVSCDISEEALDRLRAAIPAARTVSADMRAGLPFDDGSFGVVVADLCLHYFGWEETRRIVSDIGRILRPGGALLCRVNSTKDIHHGAGQGEKLEDNYYLTQGRTRRFFDLNQLEALFRDWETLAVREDVILRYEQPKSLWEIAVKKP